MSERPYHTTLFFSWKEGHGELWERPDFKSAIRDAKEFMKDPERCTDDIELVSVTGNTDQFCILFMTPGYYKKQNDPIHFKDQLAYDNWMRAALKCINTGKVVYGNYSTKIRN